MHIKIYFNEKPLFLTDSLDGEIAPYSHHDDAVLIDEFSSPGINSMIHEMRQQKIHAGIYYHSKLDDLKKAFWRKFTIVQAAGGLVLNEQGDVLMIFRKGKWDLPKGKLDKGETLEKAAVRETQEETGLKKVRLDRFLLTTYHTYDEKGKHVLKESWWYILNASGSEKLKPQLEEQITKLEWVPKSKLSSYIRNTYPSVIDVLKEGGYV